MQPSIRTTAIRGFTLTEALVAVTVMALLATLLLPLIRQVRESALGVRCAVNLRQISTATTAYAADQRGMAVLSMNPAGQYWFQVLSGYTEDQAKVATASLGQIIRGCPRYRSTSTYKSAVALDNWWTVKDMCGYSETFFLRGDAPYDSALKGYTSGCTWYKSVGSSSPGGFTANNPLARVTRVADRPLFWDACHDSGEVLSWWLPLYPALRNNTERHSQRGNAVFVDGHVARTTAAALSSAQGLPQ